MAEIVDSAVPLDVVCCRELYVKLCIQACSHLASIYNNDDGDITENLELLEVTWKYIDQPVSQSVFTLTMPKTPLVGGGLIAIKCATWTCTNCIKVYASCGHNATGSRKRPKMLLVVTPGALRGISCATRQSCTQMVKYDESTLNYQFQPP